MTARKATAMVVSRTLRQAGMCPSQPSRVDRTPALQVSRWMRPPMAATESAVVSIRGRSLDVNHVVDSLTSVGYETRVRVIIPGWTCVYVTESGVTA